MQKPGLCLPTIKIEAQDVKKAMRKLCFTCDEVPAGRRLLVRLGSGRSEQQRVYCATCGQAFTERRLHEFASLLKYLKGALTAIRLHPFTKLDPCYHESTAGKNLRPKKSKPVRPLPEHMRTKVTSRPKPVKKGK